MTSSSVEPVSRGFRDAPVPLYVSSPSGEIEDVNSACSKLLEDAPETISGDEIAEYVHPDDRAELLEAHRATDEGERRLVVRWRGSDDAYRRIEWRGRRDGDRERVVATLVETTAQSEVGEQLASANRRLSALIESAPLAVITVDEAGRVQTWNAAAEELFGWERDEVRGEKPPVLPEESLDDFASKMDNLREGQSFKQIDVERETKSGETLQLRLSSAPITDRHGTFQEAIAFIEDMTEQRRRQAELEASEARFRRIFEESAVGIALVDFDGDIVDANPKLADMLGYDRSKLAQLTISDITHPDDLERDLEHLRRQADDEQEYYELDKRYLRKDGSILWGRMTASVLYDADGEPSCALGMVQDITARKQAEAELVYKARHDDLTDVLNRQAFEEELEETIRASHERGEWSYALFFLDLDDFKLINDNFGHGVGDELLVVIADRLRRSLRSEDALCRFGGDEFAILMQYIPSDGVHAIAERFYGTINEPVEFEGTTIHPSASIGVVLGDPGYEHADQLMRDSDTAMYRAKERDDRAYVVFNEPMERQVDREEEIGHELREALERDEFVLRYQPLVELGTGDLRGFETLVRWEHPDRGLVSPVEFMEVADRKDLLRRIDHEVLDSLSTQIRAWNRQFDVETPLVFGVNCTGRYCLRPEYLEHAAEQVAKLEDVDCRTEFEIGEEILLNAPTDLEEIRVGLDCLKEVGARICIDDFGTHLAALTSLIEVPADSVKLDSFFLTAVDRGELQLSALHALTDLAESFDLELLAKGVESPDHLRWLLEIGCRAGQGYLFAPPLDDEEATDLLASDETLLPAD